MHSYSWTTSPSAFCPSSSTSGRPRPPEEASLCPALFRVSKQVYAEAVPLLYGDNHFRFAELDSSSTLCHTPLVVFVWQIGPANARQLRHVSIDFPTVLLARGVHASALQDMCLENIDLLWDACPNLTTLDLSLPLERTHVVLGDTAVFTKFLDVVQTRLGAFASLQEVRCNVTLL